MVRPTYEVLVRYLRLVILHTSVSRGSDTHQQGEHPNEGEGESDTGYTRSTANVLVNVVAILLNDIFYNTQSAWDSKPVHT